MGAVGQGPWRSVADRLIQTPPDSFPFNWGEGVQMIGLMQAHALTNEARYADYMERWVRQFVSRDIRELLDTGVTPRGERPGYCGYWSPATAIFHLYEARPMKEYLALADSVCAFVRDGAERGPEGALGHWIGSHQLWVDTLYMACPLLSALGRFHGRSEWIDDAVGQIVLYAKHLQDPASGLFYHMWDWRTGERSPILWGRGNGWVLMSIADTVEVLKPGGPRFRELSAIATAMLAGLRKTHRPEGTWNTILDDPASYPEASAASMFCYGLIKLVRLKALPASDALAVARRAWSAVTERYVRDGIVTGVSAGTDPGNAAKYRSIRTGSQTWGTGAYLMAGSEMLRAG